MIQLSARREGTKKLIVTLFCVSLILPSAYGENFPKGIKYLGGAGFADEDIKKVRKSWDNRLYVTEKEVTFGFKKDVIPPVTIPVDRVTRLTYGQATTRRVAKWVAVGVLLAPIALVGILHKSRQHLILVEWTDDQNRERGLQMKAHKKQFKGILAEFRKMKESFKNLSA